MTILFGILASLSSCKHDDVMNVSINDEQIVSICVTIPDSETRASETNSAQGIFNNNVLGVENDNYTMRYILQIFDENGRPSDETLIEYSDGTTVSFPVRLVPGRDYTFVVWADFVINGETNTDNHYITKDANGKTDLRNIIINEDSWVAMDETRDAFTGIYSTKAAGEKYSGASIINVVLTRPFAKLRVVTTDMEALANLGINPTHAIVEYTTPYRAGFNALTCTPFEADQNNIKVHQMSPTEAYAIVAYGDNTTANKVLFTDYLFASADQNDVVKFNLSVYENADKSGHIKTNSFTTDIAVKRNHLTTIAGSILTEGNNVEVVVNPDFGGYIDSEYELKDNIIVYNAAKKETDSYWTCDTFGANIVSHTFENGRGVITFDGAVTKFGNAAFQSSDITNIEIPDSVAEIGEYAFAWCEQLFSITIPANVEILGQLAFYNSNIKEITFQTSKLTHIGDGAFLECDELTGIDIPSSVINIGDSVFRGCTKLQRIYIANNQNYWLGAACLFSHDYEANKATLVAYPAGITTQNVSFFVHPDLNIGWAAFWDCDYIVDVEISFIRSIEQMNFCYCDELMSIDLDDVKYIANDVLSYCKNLVELSLPSVEVIGINTFCHNESLERIDFSSVNLAEINTIANDNDNLETVCISSSVSTISNSFNECPKLVNIYVTSVDVPTLSNSFDSLPTNAKIYVPAESYLNYISADGWRDLRNYIVAYDFENDCVVTPPANTIIFPPSNEIWYTSTDGQIVTPSHTDALGAIIVSNTYENGKGIISFDGDIETIESDAFFNRDNLESITLPNSLITIGAGAFQMCDNLNEVVMPNSVTKIYPTAFSMCYSLSKIELSDNLSVIGGGCFYGCDFTDITIPSSVTYIGEFALDCNVENIYCESTIPPTLTGDLCQHRQCNKKIYVPMNSVDLYKSAQNWSDYADKIVDYNFE